MKTNLKNFPKKHSKKVDIWLKAFEQELRDQKTQLKEYMAKVDNVEFINSEAQKAQFKGEILQIKDVLGEGILE